MQDDLRIRRARPEDAEAIYRMMEHVYRELENKEVFVCDDLEWVKEHIDRKGFAVVACDCEDKIVGDLILRFPGNEEDNLGWDIGLEEQELAWVVHMESAVVLPQYRGRHLQQQLVSYAERILDEMGYRHSLGTISPENPASYRSMEACGYREVLTKEKYGGKLRRIYYKKIGE